MDGIYSAAKTSFVTFLSGEDDECAFSREEEGFGEAEGVSLLGPRAEVEVDTWRLHGFIKVGRDCDWVTRVAAILKGCSS